MNVYPIAFFTDSTEKTALGSAELVTDMTLTNQSWTLVPAGNGSTYSGYPAGNPPSPAWSQIPNMLNETTSLSVNVLTTYLTPTSGVTCALAPGVTLPTGWTFNGTNFAYNGTSVNSSATNVQLIATLTSSGQTALSNIFQVQGAGAPITDTTAPTIPVAVAATAITQTTATLGGFPSSDPNPAGNGWDGMGQYNITISPSITGSPFAVSSAAGNKPTLALQDIGAPSPVSTFSQSGADITLSTYANNPAGGTADQEAFACQQITGTTLYGSCKLVTWAASSSAFAKAGLSCRASLAVGSAYVTLESFPIASGNGVVLEYRSSTGAVATQGTVISNSTGPLWLFLIRSGDTYTGYYSTDGNTLNTVGSVTQAMGSTIYMGVGLNANAAATQVTCDFTQVNIQNLAAWTLNLTGLTANTKYTCSITAQDGVPNVSSANSYSFTTQAATGGGGNAFPNGPRLFAGCASDNNQTYTTSTFLARVARMNYGMFNAWYDGAGGGYPGGTLGSACTTVKASNSAIKLGLYYLPDSMGGLGLTTFAETASHAASENWTLYKTGTSGTQSPNYFNTSYGMLNSIDAYTTADGSGLHVEEFMAKFMYEYNVLGTYGGNSQGVDGPASIDFLVHDNFCLHIPTGGYSAVSGTYTADWNRDGTSDYETQTDPPAAVSGATLDQNYRTSLGNGAAWVHANTPLLILGNLASWGDPSEGTNNAGNHVGGTNFSGLDGMLDGGVIEGGPGISWSQETWSGFALMQQVMQAAVAHTKGTIVGPVVYWDDNGFDYTNQTTKWQASRHNFAWSCMDNMCAQPSYLPSPYTSSTNHLMDVPWIDEFSVNSSLVATTEAAATVNTNGSGTREWLGQMISAAWQSVNQGTNKIWYTIWQNSHTGNTWVVILNPKGNGSQTVTPSQFGAYTHFTAFAGTQAPSVNNGSTVTSVTLADRDARFLKVS